MLCGVDCGCCVDCVFCLCCVLCGDDECVGSVYGVVVVGVEYVFVWEYCVYLGVW